MEFEWHAAKARANLRNHGITFESAKTVFRDAFAIERLDDRKDYGEERFILMGMSKSDGPLTVVYTERGGRIRIISARRATEGEQDDYFRQQA